MKSNLSSFTATLLILIISVASLGLPIQSTSECQIFNSLYNYTFDLSGLHLTNGQYHIKSKQFEYLINPCGPAQDSTPSVTRLDNINKSVVFGYNNETTLNHITSHILLNYKGEKCTGNSTRNTIILIECSPFIDMPPDLISEEECLITIRWAVMSACLKKSETESNKCSVFYADHLYNLAPLTHSLDSWRVENSVKSLFWLNVCKGVLKGPGNSMECPTNAAICMRDRSSNKSEVLAFTDQAHMKIKNDADSIEVVYNNSRRVCVVNSKLVQNYTITYVEYKCGQTIGKPRLLDNNDKAVKQMPLFLTSSANECIYVFQWDTRIACKNETQLESRVEVSNGIITDTKHSQVEIDMSEILHAPTEFIDDEDLRPDTGDSYKYYIKFQGNMSDLTSNAKDCQNSLVCRFDKKRKYYVSLGNKLDYFAFDVYTEILEVVISHDRIKCPSNNGKIHSIIKFYCDQKKSGFDPLDSFNFESDFEDCVYTFNWPTSRLCVRDLWLNGTYDLTTPSQKWTKHFLLTTKTPTHATANPITSSQHKVPSFVIFSLVLASIVILLVLFNNLPGIVKSRYFRVGTSCCVGVFKMNWVFQLYDQFRRVKWFGSVKRRFGSPRRRRQDTRLHGVRYKRVQNSNVDNEDSDDLLNSSSGDEVAAVFNETGNEQSMLRLGKLTPASFRDIASTSSPSSLPKTKVVGTASNQKKSHVASDSSNFDFDSQMDEIDADENVKNSTFLTRRDSRNNMLNNTDTDDDLIIV